jgi:lysophospholipase L1-like esterase
VCPGDFTAQNIFAAALANRSFPGKLSPMKSYHRLLTLIVLSGAILSVPLTTVPAQETPATRPATRRANAEEQAQWNAYANAPSDQPSIKVYTYNRDQSVHPKFMQPEEGFLKAHQSFLERAKEPVGVLFLGDSITAGWNGQKQLWNDAFGKYQPANFGIGGDRTQHVLWRIDNGELDSIKPKVVVLMIGTNNSYRPAADIATGVTAVVKKIQEKLPETKVLLLGIFPRSAKPTDEVRLKLKEVNTTLARLADGDKVRFLEIWDQFLTPDGELTREIMPDLLHLSAKGYKIWADTITPVLEELTK